MLASDGEWCISDFFICCRWPGRLTVEVLLPFKCVSVISQVESVVTISLSDRLLLSDCSKEKTILQFNNNYNYWAQFLNNMLSQLPTIIIC